VSVALHINNKPVALEAIEREPGAIRFKLNDQTFSFRGKRMEDGSFVLEEEVAQGVWRRTRGVIARDAKGTWQVQLGALDASVSKDQPRAVQKQEEAALSPRTPMPGLVRRIMVKQGDKVAKGQAIAVLEAMKLQFTLSAGGDALVKAVLAKEGELVAEGIELVQLEAPSGGRKKA
jgi:biotin carboxyl carrier protein